PAPPSGPGECLVGDLLATRARRLPVSHSFSPVPFPVGLCPSPDPPWVPWPGPSGRFISPPWGSGLPFSSPGHPGGGANENIDGPACQGLFCTSANAHGPVSALDWGKAFGREAD